MRKWRNRQTRKAQNLVPFWGGGSTPPFRTIRNMKNYYKNNINLRYSLSICLFIFITIPLFFQIDNVNTAVYYLKIDNEIKDSLYLYLNKSFDYLIDLKKQKNSKIYLIVEFDTPGGALAPTFNIVKLFDKLNDEGIITIAYINTKALSAGAIISLSCKRLYMISGSNIGSAAPILMGPFGLMPLGEYKEKIISAIRSLMVSRAQKYNRPAVILEAMVDDSFEIYKVTFDDGRSQYLKEYEITNAEQEGKNIIRKNIVKPKNILLNLTDKQALDYEVAQGIASSIEQILELESIKKKSTEIIELKKGIEDYFIELLDTPIVASIIGMIGLGALFAFFKTGSITILIVAITCLSFTPLVKFIIGLSGPVALYLILLGVVLVLLEIFVIPGTTIVGILGILSIIVGIAMNFGTITPPEIPKITGFNNAVIKYTTLTLVGSLLIFFIVIKLIYSIPFVSAIVLQGGLQEKAIDTNVLTKVSIGMEGFAITECKPIGLADFNGNIVECEAVGEFVKRNKKIEIINIAGNKIYVREKNA